MLRPKILIITTYLNKDFYELTFKKFFNTIGYELIFHHICPNQNNYPANFQKYEDAIKSCHLFVLIIGGDNGYEFLLESNLSDTDSQTVQKNNNKIKDIYQSAKERDIPTFILCKDNIVSIYKESSDAERRKNLLLKLINSFCREKVKDSFHDATEVIEKMKILFAKLFVESLINKKKDFSGFLNNELIVTLAFNLHNNTNVYKRLNPADLPEIFYASYSMKEFLKNILITEAVAEIININRDKKFKECWNTLVKDLGIDGCHRLETI